eukprot:5934351-Alexandrium_andersonii.AAC.1
MPPAPTESGGGDGSLRANQCQHADSGALVKRCAPQILPGTPGARTGCCATTGAPTMSPVANGVDDMQRHG